MLIRGYFHSVIVWLVVFPIGRRHGHLAREGLILEGEEAAEGVSTADLEKRTRLWQETKEKLKNPNFVVSPTRLSGTVV